MLRKLRLDDRFVSDEGDLEIAGIAEGLNRTCNLARRCMISAHRIEGDSHSRARWCLVYFDRENLADCKKVIQIRALSPGWREGFEDRLEKAGIAIDRHEEPEDSMCCGAAGKVITS